MADPLRWISRAGCVLVLCEAAILLSLAGCERDGPSDGQAVKSPSEAPPSQSPSSIPAQDPLAKARSDLRQAQSAYYEAYLAAVARPGDHEVVEPLLNIYQDGSSGEKDIKKRLKSLSDNGFAARPGPRGYFVVQKIDVTSVSEGASAQVDVCTYYDGITYDTKHDGPDGKPVTVNDTTESGRTRYRYVNQAGVWKLVGGDVIKAWTGENRCPAE